MKNKILVDNIIIEEDNMLFEQKDIKKIEVTGNSVINLLNCNIINLNIIVNDNSSLVINYYNNTNELSSKINIVANKESNITFNHSFINTKEYNLDIDSDFKSDDSIININIHGLNNSGTSTININGNVDNNRINNNLLENARLININGGKVISKPNMYISENKVIANHNVTISNVRSDELFYLMSKGISKNNSVKLICNGFLYNIISDEELLIKLKEINKEVIYNA